MLLRLMYYKWDGSNISEMTLYYIFFDSFKTDWSENVLSEFSLNYTFNSEEIEKQFSASSKIMLVLRF